MIRYSTISVHRAKEGYDYPTIRLLHTLTKLAGLPPRIYQSIYEGALASLVIAPTDAASENASERTKMPALTWRRSPVRMRLIPSFFLQLVTLKPSIEAFSDRTIMVKKKHNKDKKLHNSNELDLSWQEAADLRQKTKKRDSAAVRIIAQNDEKVTEMSSRISSVILR